MGCSVTFIRLHSAIEGFIKSTHTHIHTHHAETHLISLYCQSNTSNLSHSKCELEQKMSLEIEFARTQINWLSKRNRFYVMSL